MSVGQSRSGCIIDSVPHAKREFINEVTADAPKRLPAGPHES